VTEATEDESVDVVVVGGGNAAFCAAHAARERGRSVVLLEKASADDAGGNSYFTAGATRMVHSGLSDLIDLVEPDPRMAMSVVPPYSAENFAQDMERVTEGRNDKALTKVLVDEIAGSLRWLKGLGFKYRLMYERQAYTRADGSYLFWGGLHVGNVDGGRGLMSDHTKAASRSGIDVRYGHRVLDLLSGDGAITGVTYRANGGEPQRIRAESVILAAGGFEADAAMRREHLGAGWENAKVRGTPLNTGDMILAAIRHGATQGGDWGSCHSVAWDAYNEHNESNRELTNRLTRQSYPLGIVVNREGRRFLDEGADFRNYTYAKYGREILAQSGSVAFQIFDAALRPQLRSKEYEMPGISEFTAETLEDLADQLGVPQAQFVDTVSEFNSSIDRSKPFDPTVKDGRRANTVPPKSNWSAAIETGPFFAYPVTCAITFTFGGLKSDTHGRVLRETGEPISNLFVAGEMLGGLFSANYPGGSGLAAGMVFGRRAGSIA